MNRKLHLLILSVCITQIAFTQAMLSLKGNYLGQKPPGMKPELFAPGIISTKYYEHSAPAFSPDGKTVLWTVIYERGKPSQLMEMRQENGVWTQPAPPAFADKTADDFYPTFSADGKKLYFNTRRKVPAGYKEAGLRIWEVEKKSSGWGMPVPFDSTVSVGEDYSASFSNDGSVFFSIRRQNGRVFDIVSSKKINNQYQKPVVLPYNINTNRSEDGAFIAPDGSYLIFESARPGSMGGSIDLYISFRRKDGTWGLAKNMGPNVNSNSTERFAKLSPDGKYLFFGSDRNIKPGEEGTDVYWVDAKVIDELKKKEAGNKESSIDKEGAELLAATYGNDFAKTAGLLKQWLLSYPSDDDAFVNYVSALRRSKQIEEANNTIKLKGNNLPTNIEMKIEVALVMYELNKNEEAEKYILSQLQPVPQQRFRFTQLASQLYQLKKYSESAAIYDAALKIQPIGGDYYNMACSWSLSGNKDKAFEALNNAADNGYAVRSNFENDEDLASLKADSRWAMLMQKLDAPFNGSTPYKRAHHELVYDESTKSILLVGGSTPLNGGQSGKFFNDFWKYNGAVWSKVGNIGDERSGIRLAYNSKQNKIYSFGGFTGNNQSSGQLRVYENGEWKILSDLPEMKATEAGFVYDIARDKFVAFGGGAARGQVNNITWEWDGNAWKKFEGKCPEGRQAFAMVYDSKRNKTVLFGGADGNRNIFNDGVWEFDGTAWKNIVTENNPGERISPGYAFDSKRNQFILFGGISKGELKNDLWAWDGTNWKLLSSEGPPKRAMGYLAYDKNRDKIVLFGGRLGWPNDADDTWEWDGAKWNQVSLNQIPVERWGHQSTYDTKNKQALIFGGSNNGQDIGDLWAWNGSSWKLLSQSGPSPRIGSLFVFDQERGETILFGGRSNEKSLNDTWRWDGITWTKIETSGPAGGAHVVGAYDPNLKGVVLYGGFGDNGPLTETWLWNGLHWTKLSSEGPPNSFTHSMAFDYNLQRLILLTVKLPENKISETWEFKSGKWEKVPVNTPLNVNGSIQAVASNGKEGIFLMDGEGGISWTLKNAEYKKLSESGPLGRSAYSLVFDSDRNKIILFGGGIPNTSKRFNDLWEWDGAKWNQVKY